MVLIFSNLPIPTRLSKFHYLETSPFTIIQWELGLVKKFLIVLLFIFSFSQIKPCDCIIYLDWSIYVERSDFVFIVYISEVEKIELDTIELKETLSKFPSKLRTRLLKESINRHPIRNNGYGNIEEVFKGDLSVNQNINLITNLSNCDISYQKDEYFLIFAEMIDSVSFHALACTPSGKIDLNSEKVRFLRDSL